MDSDSAPRITMREASSTVYPTVEALAQNFDWPVFEPAWWPTDIGELTYEVKVLGSGLAYYIGSVRDDGAPIVVLGQAANPRARLPPDSWRPARELADVGGLIGGEDGRRRVVLSLEQERVQLIGYRTEADAVRAAQSLRRVAA
jgi:hypothetical protein